MDNVNYILGATELHLLKNQNRIADQVANASTTAFKLERDSFGAVLLQQAGGEKASGAKEGGVAFGQISETFRDMEQGPLESTGRSLDVAIRGEGFFMVETPLGQRYTRDGSFTVNMDGDIVTKQGYRVLGPGGQQTTLAEEDSSVTILENGVVTNQDREERGQIGVFLFENPSLLERLGNNILKAPEGMAPLPYEQSAVVQGALEGSNVSAIQQMTELIQLSNALQRTKGLSGDMHDLSLDTIRRLGGLR